MELMIGLCVAFALALLGASFLFWLAERSAARRDAEAAKSRQRSDALLEVQLRVQEKLLLGLVDRIQSPTPQAFAARQEAVARAEVAASLTPEERKAAAEKLMEREKTMTVNDYFAESRWRNDPALSHFEDIRLEGEQVILQWEEDGMPYMERVPQGQFVLEHVLRPMR